MNHLGLPHMRGSEDRERLQLAVFAQSLESRSVDDLRSQLAQSEAGHTALYTNRNVCANKPVDKAGLSTGFVHRCLVGVRRVCYTFVVHAQAPVAQKDRARHS